jgi:O-antigen ligase
VSGVAASRCQRWIWPALIVVLVIAVLAAGLIFHKQPASLFEYACAGAAGIAFMFVIWHIDPAWTVSAALVLTVFSGEWNQFGLPSIPLDRFVLAAGLIVMLARGPGAADRPTFVRRPSHWLLAFAAAYATIDAFVAHTLTTNSGFFKLIDRYGVIPFLLFGMSPLIFYNERQRRILLGFVVGLGLYLGVVALFEMVHLNSLVIPHWITNPNLGFGEVNSQGLLIKRARGPFLEPITNGVAMIDCGVAAALAAAVWKRRSARLLALAVVVLSLMGALFTLERTIWLAAPVTAVVGMLCVPRLRRFAIPAVAVSAALVAVALVSIPGLAGKVENRLNDSFTITDRTNLQDAGLRMLAARPLFGWGWNKFSTEDGPYLIQPANGLLTAHGDFIHNTYLSNAVELGSIGALIWLVALLSALASPLLRRGPPAWQASHVAIAACFLLVAAIYPVPLAFPASFLMIWAGVVDATGHGRHMSLLERWGVRRYGPAVSPMGVVVSENVEAPKTPSVA